MYRLPGESAVLFRLAEIKKRGRVRSELTSYISLTLDEIGTGGLYARNAILHGDIAVPHRSKWAKSGIGNMRARLTAPSPD